MNESTYPTVGRRTQELAGPWRFLVDPENYGEQERWFSPDCDHAAWAQVTVPGPWDLYSSAMWGYESVGWYVLEIPGDQVAPDRWQRLRFNRVSLRSKVWLNGHTLGENTDAYLPFEMDASPYLNAHGPNTLVVRVDNARRKHWLPGGSTVEWVQYGGILRPVELATTHTTFISHLGIAARPAGAGAEVVCDVEVTNRGSAPVAAQVVVRLTAPGRPQASAALTVEAGATAAVSVSLDVEQAERWSPQAPALYDATAALEIAGERVDAVSDRFGVRTIEARGAQVLLNGEPLQVRGVNRYDEVAGYGPTVPADVLRADLETLKRAGVNFIRMHYPHDPLALRMMDEMGILVMEEIPLNWWAQSFMGDEPDEDADVVIDAAEETLVGMIRRDRNHPCIVMWSMANECGTDTEVGIAAMRRLMRRARKSDGARLVTFVAASEPHKHLAFDEADIVCTNGYPGLFDPPDAPAKAVHIADMDARVRAVFREQLAFARAAFPDQPILVTEFGGRSIPGMRGDAPYSEDHHAAWLEAAWRGICEAPEIVGGVVWSWADYYHQRDFVGLTAPMPFGPFGVVTVDRRPKQPLYALARMFGGEVRDESWRTLWCGTRNGGRHRAPPGCVPSVSRRVRDQGPHRIRTGPRT